MWRKRLPSACVQCGRADTGTCPYHMGEREKPRDTVRRLVRGLRRALPIDGTLSRGWSLPPDVVIFVPTLRCSLHCPYCFQNSQRQLTACLQGEERLSLTEWRAVVNEIGSLGLPVIVMGGELFLYPDALALLGSVKDADLPLTVITSGLTLPKVARELVAIGLNQLIVSIDGPREVHNAVRGHPRAYELATEGIKRVISERGICPSPLVQASCAISPHTQNHLTAYVEAMGSLGVDRIVFNNLIYATTKQVTAQTEALRRHFNIEWRGQGLDHRQQFGVDAELIQRELSAIRAGAWADRVFVAPPGVESHLQAYYAPGAPTFDAQTCSAVYRELWVLPDGEVGACVHIPQLSMGNVRESGLMSAWNSPRYRRFRAYVTNNLLPACARCEKLSYGHPPP